MSLTFGIRFSYQQCSLLGEPSSLRIRLTFPGDVLPQSIRAQRYLSLSEIGPGMRLELTDQIRSNRTDFHISETERLSVCSERRRKYLLKPESCV